MGYAVVYQTTELPGSKPRDEGKEEEQGKRLHECRDDAGYIYYARDGAFDEISRYILKDGDLLISLTGNVGRVGILPTEYLPAALNQRVSCIRIKQDANLSLSFLYYYLLRKQFMRDCIKSSKGVAQLKLSTKWLENYLIPVFNLETQKKIVSDIEDRLSQLDSAVETLNKTKQQLEIYRQAVLKEAFANFKEFTTIRSVTSLVTSGSRGWAKYYSASGAAFIRIGNLNRYDISISFDDLQCVKLPDHAEGVRSRLEPSDVLISITADLGSIGFVPYNIGEGYINQHIALVRFKNKKQSRFFAWYLRSEIGQKELLKNKRGAGKLGLGLDDIRDSLIPVVDDTTAIEVVSKIEEKLVLCSNVEETINQSLQQAEALRQSILKQAFEDNS